MFQLYFFTFLLLILATLTAYFGPNWLVFVSGVSSFFLGVTISLIIFYPRVSLPHSILIGLLSLAFITGFGKLNRKYRQRGKIRLKKTGEYLFQDSTISTPTQLDGEKIIRSSLATFYTKFNAIGGHIYLTEKQIIFQPNPTYYTIPRFSIALTKIDQVELTDMFGFIKKTMKIYQLNGGINYFLVEDRSGWKNAIEETLTQNSAPIGE